MIALEQARQHLESLGLKQAAKHSATCWTRPLASSWLVPCGP